ncbi:MAG: DUF84 family protein [Chloroflexi bacterium]|nr:DUF84 family protein [Chloroflexota bacterium]
MLNHPLPQEYAVKATVGSTSRPKLRAVRQALAGRWPNVTVDACDAPSGVGAQPFGAAETVLGASNRAQFALTHSSSDLGIGLEGGIERGPGGDYLLGWVAILDGGGRLGAASTGRVLLPPRLAEEVRLGVELGPAIDRWLGRQGTRHDSGAIGVLTDGLVQRDAAFAQGVIFALAPFLHPDWYPDSSTIGLRTD